MGYNVVILVGGESTGTRFRPLSINCPKTLFPLAGKPSITHIIEALMNQLGDEIDHINLLGFFKDTSVFEKYASGMRERFPGVGFKYFSESQSKGTAGGLYQFRDEIFKPKTDGLIFIHGDVICDYPFKKLHEFHVANGSDTTILGVNPLLITENLRKYLTVKADDSDSLKQGSIISNFGTIIASRDSLNVEHYVEKPSSEFSVQFGKSYDILISGGIYFFKSTSIKKFLGMARNSDTVSSKLDNISLELDILRNLPQFKDKFLVFKSNEFWYHLKTPLSAVLANSFFLKSQGLTILSPIEFSGCNIGPNVTIGNNVNIGKGVRIRDAIIGDNVRIGNNCFIVNAIISNDVTIGDWCRIEGSITNSTICKDVVHSHSDGGIKYINSIVVLCEHTTVLEDKFVFNSIVLPHKELRFDTKYEIVM